MTSVGTPLARVEGLLKATGTADYTADIPFDDLTYAVSCRPRSRAGGIGRYRHIRCRSRPGVVLVLTHLNAPKLRA